MPWRTIDERWTWWRDVLGSPRYVLAPMVLQSELAFRMMVRRHGVTLCYSPMIPVQAFLEAAAGRGAADGDVACEHPLTGGPATQAVWFTTHPDDRPTLLQLGGSDPSQMLAVALLLQDSGIDGIDVNFGCPQRCAEQGGYGAFLMDDPDRARQIVRTLVDGLRLPVTAKMRILPDLAASVAFALMLEEAGAACVAVHGRLRDARQHEGAADLTAVKAIKAALRIPVISNGNVRRKADADACLAETGVDAVMSATALLANPRCFADAANAPAAVACDGGSARCLVRDGRPTSVGRRSMSLEYLDCCARYPDGALPRMISDHLLALLRPDLTPVDATGRPLTPAQAQTNPPAAWRLRLKRRCKDYHALRTPDQFVEAIVRPLELGWEGTCEGARAASEPCAAEQLAGVSAVSSVAHRGRSGRAGRPCAGPGGAVPAPVCQRHGAGASAMDAQSIEVAVRRGVRRRRRHGGSTGSTCCTGHWWGCTATMVMGLAVAATLLSL